MNEEKNNTTALIVLCLFAIIGFFVWGAYDFSKGYKKKTQCSGTAVAQITEIREQSSRGLTSRKVYYEFTEGDTLYQCMDYFSFFVSYPKGQSDTVHYNVANPSESYIGETPSNMKNGIRDFIVAAFLTIFFLVISISVKKRND